MQNLINQETIKDFLTTYSPSGNEIEIQSKFENLLDELKADVVLKDSSGNVTGLFGNYTNDTSKPTIMLAAHADEIAWQIQNITNDGKIYVIRLGGSDESIAASKVVIIHTRSGKKIKAVFGWPAIHVRKKEESATLDNICIDAGYDSKENVLAAGINIGDAITYENGVDFIGNLKIVSKAIDNKIGSVIILQAINAFIEIHPDRDSWPFIIAVSNCVQEEVGCRGAKLIAHNICPDIVFVTDVCHSTDSFGYNQNKQGDIKLGAGAAIVFAAPINNFLVNRLVDLANENNIIHQCLASGSTTGTDADSFAYAEGGIPTLLIKTPLRYMHTTVEMCDLQDVSSVAICMFTMLLDMHKNFSDYPEILYRKTEGHSNNNISAKRGDTGIIVD